MRSIKEALIEVCRTEQTGDSEGAAKIMFAENLIDRTANIAHMDNAVELARGALIAAGAMTAAVRSVRDLETQFLEASLPNRSNFADMVDQLDTPAGMLFVGMVLSIGVAMGKEESHED